MNRQNCGRIVALNGQIRMMTASCQMYLDGTVRGIVSWTTVACHLPLNTASLVSNTWGRVLAYLPGAFGKMRWVS